MAHSNSYCIVYRDDCTVVRTDAELSESFEEKVGSHQGSIIYIESTAVFCCSKLPPIAILYN